MMEQQLVFDAALLCRYDKSGPRYTSYPTAVQFHAGFGETQYRASAARSQASGNPLSLYFHIPFCDTVCFYCACNKIATKDRSKSQPYLDRVYRELAMQGAWFGRDQVVEQLHWGGGTPTFISHDQMRQLMAETAKHFTLRDDDQGEYSIEIDPREASVQTVALLREIGFNRMSLGVQDLNPVVQKAVNRVQSEAQTRTILQAARDQGFHSVSVDLIYGLPHQTHTSFVHTLDKIIALDPDRISVFNYAHLPDLFKPQRRINESELPAAEEKLLILQHTISRLTEAGYVYIGMDHFAKPQDELAQAQRNGTLYRNFQGYATHADCDVIGFGVTSVSKVANTYSQNRKEMDAYCQAIDQGQAAVFRGVELTDDDVLRREVIMNLMCHFTLDLTAVAKKYAIDFHQYFAAEWDDLGTFEQDGLVRLTPQRIDVLAPGKLLIRNICMTFDAYLRAKSGTSRFSKVI